MIRVLRQQLDLYREDRKEPRSCLLDPIPHLSVLQSLDELQEAVHRLFLACR